MWHSTHSYTSCSGVRMVPKVGNEAGRKAEKHPDSDVRVNHALRHLPLCGRVNMSREGWGWGWLTDSVWLVRSLPCIYPHCELRFVRQVCRPIPVAPSTPTTTPAQSPSIQTRPTELDSCTSESNGKLTEARSREEKRGKMRQCLHVLPACIYGFLVYFIT